MDTLSNNAGCDSIITINLTINPVYTVDQSVDTLIAQAEDAQYQWLDCDNNYEVLEGDSNRFIPAQNGSFAVEVSQDGCTDTSSCYEMIITGKGKNTFGEDLSIYPNPSGDVFHVRLGRKYKDINVTVYNITGEQIQSRQLNEKSSFDLQFKGSQGMYYVNIKTGSGKNEILPLMKK